MNLNQEEFSNFLKRYKEVVDDISRVYGYDSNITHLLYVIVPAFVFKYGLREESYILNLFKSVRIVVDDKKDLVYQAAFSRSLMFDNQEYVSRKFIYLYNYDSISLMQLLDNLVHEFNHAVNSLKNEIEVRDDGVYLRTGLTYVVYDKNTLKSIKSDNSVILEEIINTRQTEIIINMIKDFSKYNINDREIENIIYSVNLGGVYKSNSYYLESSVCRKLLENRTFINTLENLRYRGEVTDLDGWFDNITGRSGSLKRLCSLLTDTIKLEGELATSRLFKSFKINKIKSYISDIFTIVELFNRNCNYR